MLRQNIFPVIFWGKNLTRKNFTVKKISPGTVQNSGFNFKNENLEGCEERKNEITSQECYGKDDLAALLPFHLLMKRI